MIFIIFIYLSFEVQKWIFSFFIIQCQLLESKNFLVCVLFVIELEKYRIELILLFNIPTNYSSIKFFEFYLLQIYFYCNPIHFYKEKILRFTFKYPIDRRQEKDNKSQIMSHLIIQQKVYL